MPPHTQRQTSVVPSARRPLPLPVPPIEAETLKSYLRRVTESNLLRPDWLSKLSRKSRFVVDLIEITGFTERSLLSALPELRTPQLIKDWPHLVGLVSKRAGVRSACTHCVAARSRTRNRRQAVTVFACHEELVCLTHQRWVGSYGLRCTAHEQFSVSRCPDIALANLAHRRLIKKWGRGPAFSCFTASLICFSTWAEWPAVCRAPDIQHRKSALGISDDEAPLTPRQIAAWYPNAVALAELILTQRHELVGKRYRSADVLAEGLIRLRSIVPGLSPSGAYDPFRYAILAEPEVLPTEVEVMPGRRNAARHVMDACSALMPNT